MKAASYLLSLGQCRGALGWAWSALACAFAIFWLGAVSASALTLTGHAYIDAADSGKLKYVSGGALIANAIATSTNVEGETYAYAYQFASDLDLGGYNIQGAIDQNSSQSSALFLVGGNVTNSGGGSFYFHTTLNSIPAGDIRIEAAGSITLGNVWSYAQYYGDDSGRGSVYLLAKGGHVSLSGWINVRADYGRRSKSVIVRSEGSAASQGITISGGGSGFSINAYEGALSIAGCSPIWLCTEGDITLGDDIVAKGSGGHVTIRGNYTNSALRAGSVAVHGDILTWMRYGGNVWQGSGNVSILATNLVVDGNMNTSCSSYQTRGAGIYVDVTGNAWIGGYLDTHTQPDDGYTIPSPGPVVIKALHTSVCGTNSAGQSILTRPTATQTPAYWGYPQPGDGDVTLTSVDTSTAFYDRKNPLTCGTSSIMVTGKIVTACCENANIRGNVNISAVAVYLGDAVATTNAPAFINVHYGETGHHVVTHLFEKGVKWDGVAAHNINYGLATPSFYADVPYAGVLYPAGLVVVFR